MSDSTKYWTDRSLLEKILIVVTICLTIMMIGFSIGVAGLRNERSDLEGNISVLNSDIEKLNNETISLQEQVNELNQTVIDLEEQLSHCTTEPPSTTTNKPPKTHVWDKTTTTTDKPPNTHFWDRTTTPTGIVNQPRMFPVHKQVAVPMSKLFPWLRSEGSENDKFRDARKNYNRFQKNNPIMPST